MNSLIFAASIQLLSVHSRLLHSQSQSISTDSHRELQVPINPTEVFSKVSEYATSSTESIRNSDAAKWSYENAGQIYKVYVLITFIMTVICWNFAGGCAIGIAGLFKNYKKRELSDKKVNKTVM